MFESAKLKLEWLGETEDLGMPGVTGRARRRRQGMTTAKQHRTQSRPAARKGGVTQLKRLRRFCLSIPGTIEKISHGEPTFFTPKRVFAMFANNHHGDGHVAVWLPVTAGAQEALIEEAPETQISIDLASQTIQLPDGRKVQFPIDSFSKTCILNGVDQLGYLQQYLPQVEAYEAGHPDRVKTVAG